MAERKRCAIYTRKSTEEGLEQAFNSLDAQREACAAYVMSQAHEGWTLIPELYDDGGWSGGNLERPGLKQLLADVAAGKVDIIVVYKVDRLTRSLSDFARIVDTLDNAGASFVSVTQAFNTTNSMGRLTLNVLLSFAQFEREVTGERIRDKIAASKRKGMWMGGPVPFGYRLEDRRLIVDADEAPVVRMIFGRYVALRSIRDLVDELACRGVRTKVRHYSNGSVKGGVAFTKGPLALLLKNPIYKGKVRHGSDLFEGEHEPIVDPDTWDEVQAIFVANGAERRVGRKARNPSLLTGLLSDPEGRPMTPGHATKGSRRYRYYMSRLKPGESKETAWRLPAGEIERLVIETVSRQLKAAPVSDTDDAQGIAAARAADDELASRLTAMPVPDAREALLQLGVSVRLAETTIIISMEREPNRILEVPARIGRRGRELKLVLPAARQTATQKADPVLLKLIAHAKAAHDMVQSGRPHPAVAHYGKRHFWQLLRISWLAPDIINAIVEGRQPSDLTGRRLLRATNIPLDWADQRRFFGFA